MSSTQRVDGVAMETNNVISEDLAQNEPKILSEKKKKDAGTATKENNSETVSEKSPEKSQALDHVNNSSQTIANNEPNNKYVPVETSEPVPFIGLVNQGMTCYLNSLLQSLYMTPEFRDIVFSWQFPQRVSKSIPFEIQKLFILLQTTNRTAVETTDLTKSFGWDFSEVLQQHDVQELWRVMFDALEFSFNNTQEVTRVKKLYEGRMIDYVRCLACNKIKSRPDLFQDIPLPVRPFGKDVGYSSLEEALVSFVQPEKLDGNNQYFCDACGKKCDAHKGLAFTQFPYILTMQLKRFDFDYNTQHRIKLNDRVTFPEYLDLNNMVTNGKLVLTPDGVNTGVSINNYHADSYCKNGDEPASEVIYCETNFDGNENHTVILDCDGEITNGVASDSHSETAAAVNKSKDTINEDGPSGPYNYELFSVLIHSGSAVGGHYYAYVKNLDSGKWYCFDDRNVTQIKAEQISEVYGGKTIRGSHTRSTNAYMLMYRQINKEKNMHLIQNEHLPQHIQEIIKKMNNPEEGTGESLCSSHRDMYRLRVWYRQHEADFSNASDDVEKLSPRPHRVVRLYTFADSTLNEVTTESFERLGLHHSMRRELARLVKFNETTNTVECSFDGHEEEPVGKLLDGSYHHSLLLETRKDDAEFKTYLPNSIYSRVYLIDMETGEVHNIKEITANLKQTVQCYKELVAQIFSLNLSNLKIVVERPNEKPFLLTNDDSTLGEQRCDSMCRYYATDSEMADIANCKSFEGSELYKLVNQLLNSIQVTVILPPLEADNDYPIGDNAGNNGPWSSRFTDNIEMKDSDTEKEKDKEKNEAKNIERNEFNKSPHRTLLEDQELAGVEGKWQFCCRDPSLRLTGVKRRVQAMIDCRGNVGWLRSKLARLVGAESPEHVSIYTFNGGGSSCETENECTTILQSIDDLIRTSSPLMEINHALELRVYVRPPLALGEYRGRVYTLNVEEPDSTKPLDFTINDTWTIGKIKKAVLKELKEQRNIDWSYDSCRLRKKSWKYATKVYPDFEIVGEVLRVTSGWEMYIQSVPSGQKLFSKELDGLFIFARQYFPNSGTFGQYKELFLPNGTYEEFKEKMKGEGIALDNLEFTLGHCSYPCEPSTYSINSSPDWVKASAETVPWWYSKIQSDGNVIFYKNTQEFIKDYKDKFQTQPSTSNYMPEYGKPLKIHIEQPVTLQTNNNTEPNTLNPHNSAFALTNETLIAASKYLQNLSTSFAERNRMYGSNENMEVVESVPRNVTPNEDYNYNNNFIRDNQEQFKDPIGLTDAKPSTSSFIPYHERSLKIYINRPSSTTNTSCSDIADNTVSSSVSPSTTDDTLVNNLPISDDMVTSTSDSPLNGTIEDGNLSDSHVKTPSNETMDTAETIVKTTTEIATSEDASSHKR